MIERGNIYFMRLDTNFVYLLAAIGHIVCGITDCMLAYTPNGRFDMKDAEDNDKMSAIFEGMSLKRLEIAGVMGVIALTVSAFGFIALSCWMKEYSGVASMIMYITGLAFIVPITAHHICCSVVEWFYVKLGRDKEALSNVMEFFKNTIITAGIGYVSLAVFSITMVFMIVTGHTDLPRWAALFATLPVYLILSPTKIPAKGNVANAVMFLFMFFAL